MLLLLGIRSFPSRAQPADTALLTEQQFLAILRNFHPVARAAALRTDQADAGVMLARGAFDPTAVGYLDRKSLDGKTYFDYRGLELQVPTWYGINLKAGNEQTAGAHINPERTPGTLGYAGVSLAFSQLVFDKRRAAVRQAQAYLRQTRADQLVTVNLLYYDALSAYWEWVRSYQIYRLLSDATVVNDVRRRFVIVEADQGARPYIDTTEALTQLQNFQLQQEAARLSLVQSGLELSTYLWQSSGEPYNWDAQPVVPADSVPGSSAVLAGIDSTAYQSLLAQLRQSHPKLASLGAKQSFLAIERRLKLQAFIPQVYAGASVIRKGANLPEDYSSQFMRNNHKLSLDVSIPMFYRSARAAYRQASLKIQELNLDIDQTALELEVKLGAAFAEYRNLQSQLRIANDLQRNYERMLRGELMRFEAGESTLFLVNSRENKVLEGAMKLAELRAKLGKAYASVIAATGLWR